MFQFILRIVRSSRRTHPTPKENATHSDHGGEVTEYQDETDNCTQALGLTTTAPIDGQPRCTEVQECATGRTKAPLQTGEPFLSDNPHVQHIPITPPDFPLAPRTDKHRLGAITTTITGMNRRALSRHGNLQRYWLPSSLPYPQLTSRGANRIIGIFLEQAFMKKVECRKKERTRIFKEIPPGHKYS